MIFGSNLAMPIVQVAVDTASAHRMGGIVRVDDGKAFEHPKVRLDQIEPGSLGGGPHRVDTQAAHERQHLGMIVNVVQIVQHHEQAPPRIALAQSLERFADISHSLVLAEQPLQAVAVHIVEAQELLGALQPPVGGTPPLGVIASGPSYPTDGFELQRPPFVEAHYRGALRARAVEPADEFFLQSKWGSFELFQVRMRWALKPSRRNSRRTHSSVTSGRRPWARQYSASLGTDQLENGSPRSAGLDSATSTKSLNCSARRIAGRPLGLVTCSKLAKPLSLKRCTQSYATVKWQPTRSAASGMVLPLDTWSMTRYRWCTRTDKDRSLSFRSSNRRSERDIARSCKDRGILHLLQEGRIPRIRQIKLVW